MKRREFFKKSTCAFVGIMVIPHTSVAQDKNAPQKQPQYNFDIEIFECKKEICPKGHKVGDKFKYPEDKGKLCPWLLDSMNGMIRVLRHGGTLTWTYRNTPYEKVINPNGITTEFVRCPDPTDDGVVAKITRTNISEL